MSHRILVVDDDPHIREIICFALGNAGFTALPAEHGLAALATLESAGADLVILDIGMPEMDGLEVCRRIRKTSEMPILFLSARGDEIDRVLGLELGGDDYVVKPFSPRELVARVAAILKRTQRTPIATPEVGPIALGKLTLDPQRFQAAYDNRSVPLTATEFTIVCAFARRAGIVFNRERIMELAYAGNVHVSDRTIDSHIRNIRAKFAAVGCPGAIETVHGVGFRLGDVGEGP